MKHKIIGFLLLSTVAIMLAGCDANTVGEKLSKLNQNLFFEPELNTDEGSNYTKADETITTALNNLTYNDDNIVTIAVGNNTYGDDNKTPTDIVTSLLSDTESIKELNVDNIINAISDIVTANSNLNSIRTALSTDLNSKEISTLVKRLDSTELTVDENVKNLMIFNSKNVTNLINKEIDLGGDEITWTVR